MKKYSSLFFPLLLLSVVTLVVAFIRLRLLHLPLDRDEGEYAYAGWRMINGGIPFLDYYNMKMPGIYAIYAFFFLIFGPTISVVRLGLLLVNVGNAFLTIQLGKRLENIRLGIYSGICYLIFSLQLEFQGMNAYAEHFAVFFVLAGIVLFFKIWTRKQTVFCFYSGLMMGIAFLMKQPAFVFVLFIGLLMIVESFRQKITLRVFFQRLGLMAAGSALPLLITAAVLNHFGALHNFKLFAFDYAREYLSYNSIQDGFNKCLLVLQTAIKPNIALWSLVAVSVILMFVPSRNDFRLFKILFLVFSFVAVSAGFYFRPHYFQFLVPAISLLAAGALIFFENFSQKKGWRAQYFSIAFLAIAAFCFFWNQRLYFFSMNEQTFIRKKYDFDLFNVALKAGDFISQHSKPDATVAIFGAEPEIWFYAKRKAASGYMYVYPLLESHPFADAMLSQFYDEIIKSKPDILVYTSVEGTWYANENKHKEIFDWYKAYRDSSFKRIGLIDMLNDSTTKYYWTEDTTIRPENEANYMEIDVRR